ncbi:hypothetical protein [Brevundimonas diminuta]|uniref:hypothetical protein n=1 Tax=Brevundimonas diminuta TaxID=293 RepID=UPI00137760FD|nr:hypothetical protein [Brevundimonas diminuta]
MPDVTTITNVPPTPDMPDPSLLTEVTALIVAITALLAVIVWPVLIGYGLKKFHAPISDLLKRVRAAEGMGVKVNMDDLEKKAIAAGIEGDGVPQLDPQDVPPTDNASSDNAQSEPAEPNVVERSIPVDRDSSAREARRRQREISRLNQDFGIGHDELETLAKIHPPSAVLWAWTDLEKSLSLLAESCAVSSPIVLVSVTQLYKLGVIPPILKSLLYDLWNVRQQMAAGSNFSFDDALKFGRSAQQAKRELDDLRFMQVMGIADPPDRSDRH